MNINAEAFVEELCSQIHQGKITQHDGTLKEEITALLVKYSTFTFTDCNLPPNVVETAGRPAAN
jgi:hypothetical protein